MARRTAILSQRAAGNRLNYASTSQFIRSILFIRDINLLVGGGGANLPAVGIDDPME
jgi:hypothetical protein